MPTVWHKLSFKSTVILSCADPIGQSAKFDNVDYLFLTCMAVI